MAKIPDYSVTNEVPDMMEKIVEKFPAVFPGFDASQIGYVLTKGKKSRKALRLLPVRYPHCVWIDKVYLIEGFDENWKLMNDKQRRLTVFHIMCSIPEGGFDKESKNYGKKRKFDYEMYAEEFAVTNGVPNWMDNPSARDVFDAAKETKGDIKVPVTASDIENT